MSAEQCLQMKYAPKSICYGCGPANAEGLHISSFPQADGSLIAEWTPDLKYEAFTGVLYGGLVCCLLDCHCNWVASYHLMQQNGLESPPCTVTAEHSVKFLRPTPTDNVIKIIGRVLESKEDRATITGELIAGGKVCATSKSIFVAVKEGHPAYHRW
jgi:acyl-coenzyme A thioesterase PaaI-like protein